MFGNEHRLQFQHARHLQQGGEPKVATAFDSGHSALRLPNPLTQVRLSETLGFSGLPQRIPNIYYSICHSKNISQNIYFVKPIE